MKSNYYEQKKELQNQINSLAAFLSDAYIKQDFQKIEFELVYLMFKLQNFNAFYIKRPKFIILESKANDLTNNTINDYSDSVRHVNITARQTV